MAPWITGRAGVAGRLCRGVPREDLRNAGVREVDGRAGVVEKIPGSEKRTLFDLRVDGVLAGVMLSDTARDLTGDIASLLLFGFRSAIGKSRSDLVSDAMSANTFQVYGVQVWASVSWI